MISSEFGMTGKERVEDSVKDTNVFGVEDNNDFDLDIILNGNLRDCKDNDIKVNDIIKLEKLLRKYFHLDNLNQLIIVYYHIGFILWFHYLKIKSHNTQ